jgi:hypothetical protein
MKKPFWKTTVGKILERVLIIATGMILKNQKGIKNTPNEQKVDDVFKV